MPAPSYARPVAPASSPAAIGEIGMVGTNLTFHDGTAVQTLGVATPSNPIVSGEYDVTAAMGGPARSGRFTISDASFAAGHQLYIQQSADVISTKGTRADESEMDFIEPRGIITAAGTATVYWSSPTYVRGRFRFNYRSN